MIEQEKIQALREVVGPRGAWRLWQRACISIETPRKSAACGHGEQGLDGCRLMSLVQEIQDGWQHQRLLKKEQVRIPPIREWERKAGRTRVGMLATAASVRLAQDLPTTRHYGSILGEVLEALQIRALKTRFLELSKTTRWLVSTIPTIGHWKAI